MKKTLASQLESFGLAPESAASIAHDVDKRDARSLWSELLMLGLWRNVIDETEPIERSMAGNETVQRLLASGANPDDLVDLVREVQVNAIYNIAQVIDWPDEELDLDDALDMAVSVGFPEMDGEALPLHELHSCLMERDPAGRHGEPRSIELRQFQKLDGALRQELKELILSRNFSPAALLWKKQAGGDLKASLAAVQSLYAQLR